MFKGSISRSLAGASARSYGKRPEVSPLRFDAAACIPKDPAGQSHFLSVKINAGTRRDNMRGMSEGAE
jgi:hypothetical protein